MQTRDREGKMAAGFVPGSEMALGSLNGQICVALSSKSPIRMEAEVENLQQDSPHPLHYLFPFNAISLQWELCRECITSYGLSLDLGLDMKSSLKFCSCRFHILRSEGANGKERKVKHHNRSMP